MSTYAMVLQGSFKEGDLESEKDNLNRINTAIYLHVCVVFGRYMINIYLYLSGVLHCRGTPEIRPLKSYSSYSKTLILLMLSYGV